MQSYQHFTVYRTLEAHAVQTLGKFDQPDERCITFGQMQVHQH